MDRALQEFEALRNQMSAQWGLDMPGTGSTSDTDQSPQE
jgi:hypothetical protein